MAMDDDVVEDKDEGKDNEETEAKGKFLCCQECAGSTANIIGRKQMMLPRRTRTHRITN